MKARALRKRLILLPAAVMALMLLTGLTGSAQPLLVEDFSYANGTLLTATGNWTAHSSGGSLPITVTSPSTISYPGYLSTDIGGEVSMVAGSAEDDNRTFTAQTTGTVYASCLVNLTSATTNGDYFFHLGPSPIGTTFRGRVFAKRDASSNVAFGVSFASTSVITYTGFTYSLNTTYLVVLKYEIVDGTTNDIASIYINPPLNAPIPTTGWIVATDVNSDISPAAVALRQGSNNPVTKLDGIRVSTTWSDIVGSGSSASLTAIPNTLNGFSYIQGAGPSASQSYALSGQFLAGPYPGNITVTAPADYEVSLDNANFYGSVNVPYTAATLDATTVWVRLISGLTTGNYFNENVTNTGGGATTVNVTCNGAVVLPEPTNHATAFAAGTPAAVSIPLTWTDATGGTVPTGYLVKASLLSYDDIAAPMDQVPETDATLVKNVSAGVGSVEFTGLLPNTAYYFKIWPYTNAGTYIDYKLSGTIPQATATTTILNFRSLISGAWNSASTWEINNGTGWAPATTEVPVYRTSDVLIRNGHTITVPNNLGTAFNLALEPGSLLYTNVTTPNRYVYVYGDILNDGTIGSATDAIGFDIEGPTCTISGSGVFFASRMAKFTTFAPVTDLTIDQNIMLTYTHATNDALYNGNPATTTLNIILTPGTQLTVANAGINLSGCTFTLESDAGGTASAILQSVDAGGTATVERYISGWTDNAHGWHLLSSPVASQAISPAFTDPSVLNYDFYQWDEVTNTWLNEKIPANNITTFAPGTGYLVAYASTGTKQFNGELNTADVTASNLTISTGDNYGWNLLGNPFPSAIRWNDGMDWIVPATFAQNAKVWNEPTAAYVDIAPSGIIPAMNGFMVHVESGSPASLTIPVAARNHDPQAWYKDSGEKLVLVAYDREGNTAQQCVIGANEQATAGYDPVFDSRFLAGYAPMFYAVSGSDYLSTSTLPALNTESVIELGFVKNDASQFSIGLDPEHVLPGLSVYLTDRKTGAVTELKDNAEYSFSSAVGDDPNRFFLHFAALGVNDPLVSGSFRVYSSAGNIFVLSSLPETSDVIVSNLLGQVVMSGKAAGNSLTTLSASALPDGVYVVSLKGGREAVSQKVMVTR